MWTPPERIKHPLPPGRSVTPDEAAASLLLRPLALGPVVVARRALVPAMVPWRAAETGEVTDAVVAWYERFAVGRPGAIVVEATGVRDVPSGPLLRIGDDRFVPGLRRLVEAVRRASGGQTRLFIQLIDFLAMRRRPPRDRYLREHLRLAPAHLAALLRITGDPKWIMPAEPAPVDRRADGSRPEPASETEHPSRRAITPALTPALTHDAREALIALDDEALSTVLSPREREALRLGARERVTDLEQPHIRALPQVLPARFAAAAVRAAQAGFDGCELHYAHAYTMASLLSPTNDRDDGYGATEAGRLRLPLEVIAATREAIADERARRPFAVGVRFLSDEIIDGGGRVADACRHAVAFARAGCDYLSLSRGGKFEDAEQPAVGQAAYPYTGRSGWECMPTVRADARGPFGRNVDAAAAVKRALVDAGEATPLVVAGGIATFDQAEAILRGGAADAVAVARQSLADPDWLEKVARGRVDEIRRCTYTNYCEALDQRHQMVTCKLWDRVALDEPSAPLDAAGRRRLIAPPWRRDGS